MREIGRRGGVARMAGMSEAQRKAHASMAGRARWEKQRATQGLA
jgi:hypothetical protein